MGEEAGRALSLWTAAGDGHGAGLRGASVSLQIGRLVSCEARGSGVVTPAKKAEKSPGKAGQTRSHTCNPLHQVSRGPCRPQHHVHHQDISVSSTDVYLFTFLVGPLDFQLRSVTNTAEFNKPTVSKKGTKARHFITLINSGGKQHSKHHSNPNLDRTRQEQCPPAPHHLWKPVNSLGNTRR